MEPLHPELARLTEQYNAIVSAHEAGDLDIDAALDAVARLAVVDGGGFVWGVDSNTGSFTRAVPGAPTQPADPTQFVPAQLPSRQATSAPWGADDLMRPPARSNPPFSPSAPAMGDPYAQVPPGYPGGFAPGAPMDQGMSGNFPAQGARGRGRQLEEHREPRGSLIDRFLPSKQTKLGALVHNNKRTLAIAAGVLVVLLVLVVRSGGRSDDQPTFGSPAQTVPSSVAPGATVAPAPAPPALPTGDETNATIAALISGDPAKFRAQFTVALDDRQAVLHAARFAGYAALKLAVQSGPPAQSGQSVISQLQVLDASGTVLSSAQLTWVRTEAGWRLAAVPELTI